MNFDYSEEQQLLADSVRRFLQNKYQFEDRKKIISGAGWSEEVWAQFAEMGLTALPVSTDYGGFGGGAVDLMSVMEAFGEALVVEPLLPTLVAARLVGRAASDRSWCAGPSAASSVKSPDVMRSGSTGRPASASARRFQLS